MPDGAKRSCELANLASLPSSDKTRGEMDAMRAGEINRAQGCLK